MDSIEQELRQIKEDLEPKQPTDDQIRKVLGLESDEHQPIAESEEPIDSALAPTPARPIDQAKEALMYFDRKFLWWADSRIGTLFLIGLIIGITCYLAIPTTQERQRIYQQGVCDAKEASNQPCK